MKFSLILTTFFTLLFRTFRPLTVGMTPLGQNFELQKLSFMPLNVALAPPSCDKNIAEKKCQFLAKISNFKVPYFQNLPLVERSHIYERVQLDEYYQNITVGE